MNTDEISVRLVLRLSSSGIMSRRKAAEAVKNGRVTVNGITVTDPAVPVTAADKVFCDGMEAAVVARKYYIALNKPRGYMSSNQDAHSGKLAVGLIDIPGVRLFSAGRLDMASDGLLIFSNDGDFVNAMTHPSFGITKSYRVTTSSPLPESALEKFISGLEDGGECLKALEVKSTGKCEYLFVLGEGKKRHIRRMVAAVGARVVTLTRIRHGKIHLGSLPVGQWRFLTPDEISL